MTTAEVSPTQGRKWRAIHVNNCGNDEHLETLGEEIPALASMGVNALILAVNCSFDYKSHPELRAGKVVITRQGARKFAKLCQEYGIRLIPQFQCLGHQSWKEKTFVFLSKYPEFDLTPGAFPKNKGIFCREWDPLNPKVNEIVFKLMDELIDAFDADAFHVGMDEVFLLGSKYSPSTKGKDPARVFAKAVNDYYEHLVTKRGIEMLMWGDRLIDGKKMNFDEWESSLVGTAAAVDVIPKDIIICPWHYHRRDTYLSIPMFIEKGFRVLPTSWRSIDASKALIQYSQKQENPKMLGHLFTTWHMKVERDKLTEYPPLVEGLKLLRGGGK